VWNIKSDCWNGHLEQVTDWINTEHEKLRNSFLFSSFKVEAFRACLECDSWLHHFLSDVPKFILPGVSYNFALGGLLSYILSTAFSISIFYRLIYTKLSFLVRIGHLTPWSMKKKRLWIIIIIIRGDERHYIYYEWGEGREVTLWNIKAFSAFHPARNRPDVS
jgi:hypothetical protein